MWMGAYTLAVLPLEDAVLNITLPVRATRHSQVVMLAWQVLNSLEKSELKPAFIIAVFIFRLNTIKGFQFKGFS